jgi:hypothetical protein
MTETNGFKKTESHDFHMSQSQIALKQQFDKMENDKSSGRPTVFNAQAKQF